MNIRERAMRPTGSLGLLVGAVFALVLILYLVAVPLWIAAARISAV